MDKNIELIRVKIPNDQIVLTDKFNKIFDIHENSQNLTEEYLYTHQPTTNDTIAVYSTSSNKIGTLDREDAIKFKIVQGPAVIVARKGYAGRLYVVDDSEFIVHEDAYPVKPKDKYIDAINLWWFAGHYSMEFQADRTSSSGIGDFPRTRIIGKTIIIPRKQFQDEISILYKKRAEILERINAFKDKIHLQINDMI